MVCTLWLFNEDHRVRMGDEIIKYEDASCINATLMSTFNESTSTNRLCESIYRHDL